MTGETSSFTNNGVAAVQGYNYGHATIGAEASNSNGVGQVNAPVIVGGVGAGVGVGTSKESAELLRIFESLGFKRRLALLNKASELEDEEKQG